jgi:hypothetical protein
MLQSFVPEQRWIDYLDEIQTKSIRGAMRGKVLNQELCPHKRKGQGGLQTKDYKGHYFCFDCGKKLEAA